MKQLDRKYLQRNNGAKSNTPLTRGSPLISIKVTVGFNKKREKFGFNLSLLYSNGNEKAVSTIYSDLKYVQFIL